MRKRSATPPASRKAQTSENTGKIFDQVLALHFSQFGLQKKSTRMSGRLFCLWFVFTWAPLESVTPTFRRSLLLERLQGGEECDYRDLKGGGGALTCGSLPRSRCCVFTDGVAFLYFPSMPSELYKLSDKYLDILKSMMIMHWEIYRLMKTFAFVILKKSFVKYFLKLSNLIFPSQSIYWILNKLLS